MHVYMPTSMRMDQNVNVRVCVCVCVCDMFCQKGILHNPSWSDRDNANRQSKTAVNSRRVATNEGDSGLS